MSPTHLALAMLANLVWAFNFIATKYGLLHFPPLFFTGTRFALLLLLLLPLLLRPLPTEWRQLLLIGLMMGVVHFSLMSFGLAVSPDVSSVAIANQLYVPFSTLLAVLLLGERIRWRRILGIVIAFSGVIVIGFDPVVFDNLLGLLLVASASLAIAVCNILISRLRGRVPPMTMQAWIALVATPSLMLLSLIFEDGQWVAVAEADWLLWLTPVYSAIGSSLIGHGIVSYLLGRYPVSTVTPLMLLTPLLAVVFGVTIWGDSLTPALIIGGAMTVLGVTIIVLRSAKRAHHASATLKRDD